MKKSVIPIILMVMITLFPLSTLKANPGYSIDGDKVIWENEWGKLEVYPHTSFDLAQHTQFFNFTWKKPDTNIDIAFRFPVKLTGGELWIWQNMSHQVKKPTYDMVSDSYVIHNILSYVVISEPEYVDYGDIPSNHYINLSVENGSKSFLCGFDSYDDWGGGSAEFFFEYYGIVGYHYEDEYWFDYNSKKDKIEYLEYNNQHYYILKNVPIVQDKQYHGKWRYDMPVGTDGKWDLFAKLSSDGLQYALDNNRYVMIDPWWNSNWNYFITITVNSSYIDNPLVDFPVWVQINSTIGALCDDNRSIRFLDIDNVTQYAFDIENWNGSAGDSDIWVRIPRVESATDTVFLMYFNNSAASTAEDKTGTWSSDFLLVNHMYDNTTSTTLDSTSYWSEGSKPIGADNPIHSNGKVFEAQDFSSDYISHGTGGQYDIVDGTMSMSAWIRSDTTTGDNRIINFPKSGAGGTIKYTMVLSGAPHNIQVVYDAATGVVQNSITGAFTNWNYMYATYDGTGWATLYRNGVQIDQDAGKGNIDAWSAGDFRLGSFSAAYPQYFDGDIEEVRLEDVCRNSSWVKACYYNFNMTDFLGLGSMVSQPVTPGGNTPPQIDWYYPFNNSDLNCPCCLSLCVNVSDNDSAYMNLTINWNNSGAWEELYTWENVMNGSYCISIVNFSLYGWTYMWNISVDDGNETNNTIGFIYLNTDSYYNCNATSGGGGSTYNYFWYRDENVLAIGLLGGLLGVLILIPFIIRRRKNGER